VKEVLGTFKPLSATIVTKKIVDFDFQVENVVNT
jgi:hypothetical protein